MPAFIISYDFVLAAIIIACGLIVGRLGKYLLGFIEKRITSKTDTPFDDKIIVLFKGRITTIFVLIGTYVAITELQGRHISEYETSRILHFVNNAFFVVALYVSSRIVLKILFALVEWYFEEPLQSDSGKISETVTPLIEKFLTIVVMLGSFIIILDHFGVNIGSLLVSLGVGSLAIALAAQETIANMIAGVVILVDRPFRVGDRVQLQSGEIGDVMELGLRSTRILNFDKNIIVVPNTELVKNRLVNYSYPNPQMRVLVRVGIAYTANVDQAKTIILTLYAEHPNILKDPATIVNVVDLAPATVVLEANGYTDNFKKRYETETQLRERILDNFKREGIEIPVQQVFVGGK